MSLSDWKEYKIADLIEIIFSGGTPNTKVNEYWNGSLPWLSSGETKNRYINSTEKTITESGAQNSSTRLALSGDVVMASAGQGYTRGQVSFLNVNTFINQSVIAIRANEKLLDKKFLFYNLSNRYEELRAISDSNSIRGSITTKMVKSMTINIPNLDTQKSIANVLSSIDDKIENNKKINHHLEQIAQAIFKSWFVDFEPFGGVKPSDWGTANLTDIAEYLNGLAMQKYRPVDDEESLPVLKIKELRQGTFDSSSDLCSANIKSQYIIQDGDVIFSWSGSLLVDFWTGGTGGLNQHLFKVSSQKYDKWFYYSWTKYYLEEFIAIAADKATTMGHITRRSLEKAKILIPNDHDYKSIGLLLAPIYRQIISNRIESRKLTEMRDTLLPKLLSGEISVNQATK
ncbi:restriction endonuclease subunit S [Streptococcus gordonii]|uniref:restriction endonuclease subunit S n=1 Tax=Streptococcus gordonii TaxID=1302 RepID=UPI0020012C04|nr:restriction endonuclease subunit S [Streptococcus gordonii]